MNSKSISAAGIQRNRIDKEIKHYVRQQLDNLIVDSSSFDLFFRDVLCSTIYGIVSNVFTQYNILNYNVNVSLTTFQYSSEVCKHYVPKELCYPGAIYRNSIVLSSTSPSDVLINGTQYVIEIKLSFSTGPITNHSFIVIEV